MITLPSEKRMLKMARHMLWLPLAFAFACSFIMSIPRIALGADGWLWPVPASQQINQYWSEGHKAIDIGGSRGTPIVASRAGTVYRALTPSTVDVNWGGYGYGVVIDHGDGYYSHYAHMDSLLVSEGQSVQRGQQLGGMGATGNATGVHLHFAIKTSPYGGDGGAIRNDPGDINYDYNYNQNHDPVGELTEVSGDINNCLHIKGWAYDPDVLGDAIKLHVYVGGPANSGAPCYQVDAVGNQLLANYQYRFRNSSEFYYTLQVNESGLQPIYVYAINTTANSHNPELSGSGANAVICVGDKGNAVSDIAEGRYAIVSKRSTSYGFSIKNASIEQQAQVCLDPLEGGSHQQFRLQKNGEGSYVILASHSDQAVEIHRASTDNGKSLTQHEFNRSDPQRWWIERNADATYSLRNKVSGKYVFGTDDRRVVQDSRTRDDNQKWYLVPVSASLWDVEVQDQWLTGGPSEPRPTVVAGGLELTEGKDYSVTYSNNNSIGTARLTVTGRGVFEGVKTVTFNISGVDRDGWVTLASGTKGYAKGGSLVTGWLTLGDDKYWFDGDGAAAQGWSEVSGQTYYFREDGTYRMARGWATVGGQKYLFRGDGRLGDGWVSWDGAKYYADEGVPREGWQTIGGTRYFFREDGTYRMASGWATIAGEKWLFRTDGRLADGWATLEGENYYADAGKPRTGWQLIDGSFRYFRPAPDYRMARGLATIDGRTYQFDSLGNIIE